jgi:hypothetical protein
LLTEDQASIGSCKEVDPWVMINMLQKADVTKIVEIHVLEEEKEITALLLAEIEQVPYDFEVVRFQ